MTAFTPLASTLGGVLIGLSAVGTMLMLGRIAGIAGITTGAAGGPDRGWRLAFLGGLVAAPLAVAAVTGEAVVQTVPSDPLRMIAAGLVVGVGVRLGSGCTSGHGVCGLARLSPRSLAAVATFMATAFATVFVMRHAL